MNTLQVYDYLVFLVYFFIVAGYGYYVYKRKQTKSVSASHDYFLAEGSLTWWAIGTSLIASNISSEQFIAMSGNGFKMGLAIATYEWMAALTLIIVAVFFIPVYLKNKIYTMPQFLSERYNGDVAMIMAVFCLLLYVIYMKGGLQTQLLGADWILNPDKSYPVLLNLLPVGLQGLSFAALTAAVVASLAGKVNSISTIFTLDIFKKKITPNASE